MVPGKEKNIFARMQQGELTIIAGPCSIESFEVFLSTAQAVKAAGGNAMRGGAYKMRTHPHAFQGLGQEGLEIAHSVCQEVDLPFVCEITDVRQIETLDPFLDVYQVGTRNMHNFELLKELGKQPKPVLLKRGFAAFLDEMLAAASYIFQGGNTQVIFCERGIRTFEKAMRNTLDLSAVPYLQKRSNLPVIVDPSHGTGIAEFVPVMSRAAVAAGANGVIIEIHPQPETALSDKEQTLDLGTFQNLVPQLHTLARVCKEFHAPR